MNFLRDICFLFPALLVSSICAAQDRGSLILDPQGRALIWVQLDEMVVRSESGNYEAPARSPRDPYNLIDRFAWHKPSVRAIVRRMESQYGVQAHSMTSHSKPSFGAYMTLAAAESLSRDYGVEKVEPIYSKDAVFSAVWTDYTASSEMTSWGKIAIGTDDSIGANIGVYMIDGSINGHNDLFNITVGPFNTSQAIYPAHATHVAGILAASSGNSTATRGINPGMAITSLRNLVGDASEIAQAIDWALQDGETNGSYGIVNISQSGSAFAHNGSLAPYMRRGSIRNLMVQAAGNNNGAACNYSYGINNGTSIVPVENDGILGVGGIDDDGAQLSPIDNSPSGLTSESGSNHGPCAEVWAPAEHIYSSWHTSTTAMERVSGTSMASPHVAALAARYGTTSTSPAERESYIRSRLFSTGYIDSSSNTIKVPSYTQSAAFTVIGMLSPSTFNVSAGSNGAQTYDRQYLSGNWNSGGSAPQWIEYDLGSTKTIRTIRMVPEMNPSTGTVTHEVYVGSTSNPSTLAVTYTGTATLLEPITVNLSASARWIRIVTTSSPSWVSWREIEILGY